jgi:hypothetical protein
LTGTNTSLESGVALQLRCGSGYLRLSAIGQGCDCGDPRLGEPNIGRLLANRSRGVSASVRRFDRSPRRGLCRTVPIRRRCSRNMLVNSCIGANRLLLMRARCVPRSDRTTDQWSPHRPIDIHCKRLSGRIFGTSLRRGEMPAKTRRRSCPWRPVWQTPDRGVCRSARRWRAALRTARRGCNKCVVQFTKSA